MNQADLLTEQSTCLSEAHIHHRESSHSTNSELIEAIKDGTLNADVIHQLTADCQTAGRGQHGRRWQSPLGNVYLSVYYPVHHQQFPLTAPLSGLLSLCVGYHLLQIPMIKSINQYRIEQGLPQIGVKWANDIGYYPSVSNLSTQSAVVNQTAHQNVDQNVHQTAIDKNPFSVIPFSKLSGTLIEPVNKNGQLIGIVIGVGMNVLSAPELTSHAAKKPIKQTTAKFTAERTAERVQQSTKQKNSTAHNQQSISLQQLIDSENIVMNTAAPVPLAPSVLYQPIRNAIVQAMWTHQKISGCQYALSTFLQHFAEVNILRNRYVCHPIINNQSADKNKFVDQSFNGQFEHQSEHQNTQISKVMGIDSNGCLQIITDDNKLCRLFTGSIEVVK